MAKAVVQTAVTAVVETAVMAVVQMVVRTFCVAASVQPDHVLSVFASWFLPVQANTAWERLPRGAHLMTGQRGKSAFHT